MTFEEVMAELEAYGNEQTKKTFLNHGATEPLFGVRVGDLKKILKHIKKDQELALRLYDTGNYDAMYLAGLAVNPKLLSEEELRRWVEAAKWHAVAEYTIGWVAGESPYALKLAREWIASDREMTAVAGWSTYANYVMYAGAEEFDFDEIRALLQTVEQTIHQAPNRVRYVMNQFVICVGSYILELRDVAKTVAATIGKVQVNMGNTACKVPLATDYIDKVLARGEPKKKKTLRC
ncbi:DNA alkylation repair protein [Sporosarcina sp. FSL K6-1522]|uniref:DNA alkylation repair protein n=1 Tax=Sporosarcina sp. FSL K6-1522 TaxID=2921554 RepID=UPI003159C1FC